MTPVDEDALEEDEEEAAEDAEVCLTVALAEVVAVDGGGNVEEALRSVFAGAFEEEVLEVVVEEVVVDVVEVVAKPGILEEKIFLDMLDMVCMRDGCSVTGSSAAETAAAAAAADGVAALALGVLPVVAGNEGFGGIVPGG